MGVALSAIFNFQATNPSKSQVHGHGLDRRPSLRSHSRGSSLGPTPSLMYETVPYRHDQPSDCDIGITDSLRPTTLPVSRSSAGLANSGEQQPRQEHASTEQQVEALLESLKEPVVRATSSVPIPQLQHAGLRERAHDTTATRVKELQQLSSSVALPYIRPRHDTFGESIRAFPPRKLYAYPRAAQSCPTVYMQRSGLFDIDKLVAEFGQGCDYFANRLEALDDMLWHIRQQIRTREDTIVRLRYMQSLEECDACEVTQLESLIQRAAREVRRLDQRLDLFSQEAHETILEAFDRQHSIYRPTSVDNRDELRPAIMTSWVDTD